MSGIARATLLIVAVLAGYGAGVFFAAPGGIEPSATPTPQLRDTTTTATVEGEEALTTTTHADATVVYLVWSTGGLGGSLVDGLIDEFADISIVRGDVVGLDVPEGLIPLDALAIDPSTYGLVVPGGELEALEVGSVALGETSARLRGLGPGDALSIEGRPYPIAAVVPDDLVAAAEVVFHADDPTTSVTTDRFALISTEMARMEFERVVRAMYEGPAPLRIRAEGETPWLRHGDAVLPQVFIKDALGEFSYTRVTGASFTQSKAFRSEMIVTESVPIIGEVTCHRIIVDMLEGAMGQLLEEGLGLSEAGAGDAGVGELS